MLKVIAPLFVLSLLAGCGAPRFFRTEVLDEAALKEISTYHARPVDVQFIRPPTWGLKDYEWDDMMTNGDQAYARGLLVVDKPVMMRVGKDGTPDSGGVIDVKVTNVKRGHYAFVTWAPAIVDATVTITEAKTGKVVFKGFGQGITPDRGSGVNNFTWELVGDGGRLKGAFFDLGRDLAWTLEYYARQK